MRVTYLELQDIKSYQASTRIDLTEGVNAVCGANGSGKTTLLEAIGYALFDFLPYSQAAFMREGQKTGTIRVGLEGRDEREYEIVRRIGVGGVYFVADAETGDRIAERREAVLDWIRREALDIEPGTDLEALFKNAVGVPQGLMTADFQHTATTRKAIFDPLLRVEEYRQAYEELRNTVNVLRDRTASVDAEMAGLRTDTDRIPARLEEISRLRERVCSASDEIARGEELLAQQEAARSVLDAIAQRLLVLEGELRDARYDLQRYTDLVEAGRDGVERARQAVEIVNETEDSHHRFLQARQRLADLEKQSQQCHQLEKQLAAERATSDGIVQLLERLSLELRRADDASVQAAALLPLVQRQDQLERDRRELELSLRDLQRHQEDAARLGREYQTLDAVRKAREQQLVQAREARLQSAGLDDTQRDVEALAEQLARLGPIKTRLETLKVEGAAINNERRALRRAIESRDGLIVLLTERESVATQLDALSAREGELRERRAMTQAAIEYQHLARVELSRAHCPLLELECPIVSQDRAALDRFEGRAEALTGDLLKLDRELTAIKPELAAVRTAGSEAQQTRIELARLEGVDADLSRVEAQLRRCLEEHAELSRALESESEWRRELDQRRKELRSLQSAAELAATLPLLEQQQGSDERALVDKRAALDALAPSLAELGRSETRAQVLDKELDELGNPRLEEQDLVALAGRKPDLVKSIAEAESRLSMAAARIDGLLAALEPFGSLEADIQETRRLEEEHAASHERYLQHREEASQHQARTESLQSSEAALEKVQAGLTALENVLAEVQASYRPEDHARLQLECTEAMRLLIQQRERLEGIKGELARAEEEMAFLRRAETKLRSLEGQREGLVRTTQVLTFIRDTIRLAGPSITETLLTQISQGANDIYAEIVDDHAAELRWDRDYEVLVQRGPETRKFVQLSGGEQMSAALAVRLALLKEMSEVDFAFFDEPTQNMDSERRSNLAGQIQHLRGFEQLIVISHDDTFEHHTDNLIRLRKVHEATEVEST